MSSTELLATVAVPAFTALLGLSPYMLERSRRVRIESNARRRIWSDISRVRGLMEDLEKDASQEINGSGALQAVGKLSIMLRDLLCEAIQAEPKVNYATVQKWRACGRLGSDWQEHLALMLLHSEEIPDKEVEALRSRFGSMAELPSGHTMKSQQSHQSPQ